MIPDYCSKLFGCNWRTNVATCITVAFGFIAVSPEFFTHWPMLIALSKYAAIGGLAALGIASKDAKSS